jgi:hypothetical protein
VIEKAIETAQTLGSDKSRGSSLEMFCTDFLAGATHGRRKPKDSVELDRALRFSPSTQKQERRPCVFTWDPVCVPRAFPS